MTTTDNHGTSSHDEAEKQIKQNDIVYLERKREFEILYPGKILLMHDGEVSGVYNDMGDAYSIGCDKFGLGRFSLHRVCKKPIGLGTSSLGMKASDAIVSR
ncbi:MAG: hypothetical protein OXF08_06620 [Bacteroidetes bacterium]|nr:hypothetical protein [Bacteroidota bacterium]